MLIEKCGWAIQENLFLNGDNNCEPVSTKLPNNFEGLGATIYCNRVHNIWKFYKVSVQVPFATNKTELDILYKKTLYKNYLTSCQLT